MSSIKTPADAPTVAEFFVNEVLPAARETEALHGELLTRGFDPTAQSYYIQREKPAVTKADLELNLDDLSASLSKMCTDQGRPELAKLAPSIATLAQTLHQKEDQEETVSPFIYVMF